MHKNTQEQEWFCFAKLNHTLAVFLVLVMLLIMHTNKHLNDTVKWTYLHDIVSGL